MRRLPPGPVAILKLTGLAVDAWVLLPGAVDGTRALALADIRLSVWVWVVKGWSRYFYRDAQDGRDGRDGRDGVLGAVGFFTLTLTSPIKGEGLCGGLAGAA